MQQGTGGFRSAVGVSRAVSGTRRWRRGSLSSLPLPPPRHEPQPLAPGLPRLVLTGLIVSSRVSALCPEQGADCRLESGRKSGGQRRGGQRQGETGERSSSRTEAGLGAGAGRAQQGQARARPGPGPEAAAEQSRAGARGRAASSGKANAAASSLPALSSLSSPSPAPAPISRPAAPPSRPHSEPGAVCTSVSQRAGSQ